MDREIAEALLSVLSLGKSDGYATAEYDQAVNRLAHWAEQQPAYRQYVEECQTGLKPEKKGEPEVRQ